MPNLTPLARPRCRRAGGRQASGCIATLQALREQTWLGPVSNRRDGPELALQHRSVLAVQSPASFFYKRGVLYLDELR